jgi:hypothetical protein
MYLGCELMMGRAKAKVLEFCVGNQTIIAERSELSLLPCAGICPSLCSVRIRAATNLIIKLHHLIQPTYLEQLSGPISPSVLFLTFYFPETLHLLYGPPDCWVHDLKRQCGEDGQLVSELPSLLDTEVW